MSPSKRKAGKRVCSTSIGLDLDRECQIIVCLARTGSQSETRSLVKCGWDLVARIARERADVIQQVREETVRSLPSVVAGCLGTILHHMAEKAGSAEFTTLAGVALRIAEIPAKLSFQQGAGGGGQYIDYDGAADAAGVGTAQLFGRVLEEEVTQVVRRVVTDATRSIIVAQVPEGQDAGVAIPDGDAPGCVPG